MTRTIHVRGCIGCPFHRQGLDDSDDPEFTDDAGRGAADYCSAASLMQAPPRPPFVKITGGADVDLRPAWCPLDGGPVGVEAVARFDVAPSLDALARLPCTCGLMRGVCGGFHVTESLADAELCNGDTLHGDRIVRADGTVEPLQPTTVTVTD